MEGHRGELKPVAVSYTHLIDQDCELNILTLKDEKALPVLRHTASHVMAQAVKRLYPTVKLAIGPSVADGFYYDMDFETPLTSDDFEKIEAEMKKIIKENLKIVRFTKPREEAIAFMKEKGEPYLSLIHIWTGGHSDSRGPAGRWKAGKSL